MDVKGTGNTIFIASGQPGRISKENLIKRCQSLQTRLPFNFILEELANEQYNYLTDKAVKDTILTDDFAPVDVMRHQDSLSGK